MKILFDTNVILDALTKRYNSYHYSQELISFVVKNKIKGYLLTSQITDIYYCLRKYIPKEETKRDFVKLVCETFILVPVTNNNFLSCFKSEMIDFEDALIDDVARINCLDYIVTNNISDFEKSKVPAITPKAMLDLVKCVEGANQ